MKYLKDVIQELPLNCMFNKVKVGCGGTTLALTSENPYVICVPYVSLIDNKIAQNPKELWLGVKAGINKEAIYEYLNKCYENEVAPKILVTYDSLAKVTECIDPKEFYILIDEYHILFQQYSFRYDAVRAVLDLYKEYKAFTFMTATPIEPDIFHSFVLDELKDIPLVTQEWEDAPRSVVEVEAVKCKSVRSKVIDIIEKHLSGEIAGNAYFFVNSCKFISSVYTRASLNADNCRVIYSKNNDKRYKFKRGETTDAPKKINFLTSTTFEGSDIYDKNGMTYIISDGFQTHTLLDISSSVQQIVGRIRDSKYKGCIIHIFSTARYVDTDESMFEENQKRVVEESQAMVAQLGKMDKKYADAVGTFKADRQDEYAYTIFKDNQWMYDDNLRLLDLYNYIVRTQYKCKTTIDVAYQNIGAETLLSDWTKKLEKKKIDYISFKDAVKQCRESGSDDTIAEFEVRFPIIREAIEKLGYEKIATLKYVQKDIKDRLLLMNKKTSINMKIISKLNLTNGGWYSNKELKKRLQKAFDLLEIDEVATASKIEAYYSCEERVKRMDDKTVRGYIVYLPIYKRKMQ